MKYISTKFNTYKKHKHNVIPVKLTIDKHKHPLLNINTLEPFDFYIPSHMKSYIVNMNTSLTEPMDVDQTKFLPATSQSKTVVGYQEGTAIAYPPSNRNYIDIGTFTPSLNRFTTKYIEEEKVYRKMIQFAKSITGITRVKSLRMGHVLITKNLTTSIEKRLEEFNDQAMLSYFPNTKTIKVNSYIEFHKAYESEMYGFISLILNNYFNTEV